MLRCLTHQRDGRVHRGTPKRGPGTNNPGGRKGGEERRKRGERGERERHAKPMGPRSRTRVTQGLACTQPSNTFCWSEGACHRTGLLHSCTRGRWAGGECLLETGGRLKFVATITLFIRTTRVMGKICRSRSIRPQGCDSHSQHGTGTCETRNN